MMITLFCKGISRKAKANSQGEGHTAPKELDPDGSCVGLGETDSPALGTEEGLGSQGIRGLHPKRVVFHVPRLSVILHPGWHLLVGWIY